MASDTPGDMAVRIRYWREKANLSRAELAKKLELDESAIRHWECGDNAPRDLAKLATACRINLSKFWSAIPAPRKRAEG